MPNTDLRHCPPELMVPIDEVTEILTSNRPSAEFLDVVPRYLAKF